MAIICNRCKTGNKETNNYCVNCGELLKKDYLNYTSLQKNYTSLQKKHSSLQKRDDLLYERERSLRKHKRYLHRIYFSIIALLIIAIGVSYYMMQEKIDYYTFSSNRNYNEAFKWYQKAVESKATFAPNDGIEDVNWGGKVNYDSIDEYKKAAEQGNIFAQYTLGELYTKGFLDCPKDTIMAIELLNGSIEKGYAPAIAEYGNILLHRKKYSEAIEWYNKAALIGYAPAGNALGNLYARDDNQKFKLYSKSANQGYHWGEYNLGLCFFKGEGTSLNMDSAKYWLMRAASKQNSSAENLIGIIYYRAKNIQEAIKWYELSGSRGNSWAYFNLGEIYRDGIETEKDIERAKDYFKKSAELGNDSSKAILEKILLPNDSTLPLSKKVSDYWEKIKNKVKSLF